MGLLKKSRDSGIKAPRIRKLIRSRTIDFNKYRYLELPRFFVTLNSNLKNKLLIEIKQKCLLYLYNLVIFHYVEYYVSFLKSLKIVLPRPNSDILHGPYIYIQLNSPITFMLSHL